MFADCCDGRNSAMINSDLIDLQKLQLFNGLHIC